MGGLSIKSIGNFVSNNIKSTVRSGAHLAQQYVNNPITRAVAPTALSAIGVPPEVYDVVKNLQNSGLNSLQDIKKAVVGSEYSQQIQGLTEADFKAMTKKIEEEEEKKKEEEERKKEEEERKKKENKKTLYLIIGGILLVTTASFVIYKLLKKKQ
jgi:hypothetical protein